MPFCLKYGNKSNIFSPSVSCADSSLIRGSLGAVQFVSSLNDHEALCSLKEYLISQILGYLVSCILYLPLKVLSDICRQLGLQMDQPLGDVLGDLVGSLVLI